jgi:hypothetical protein
VVSSTCKRNLPTHPTGFSDHVIAAGYAFPVFGAFLMLA